VGWGPVSRFDRRALGHCERSNREDDPEYIVRLFGQVVTVSMETVRLVKELAALAIDPAAPSRQA